MTNLTVVTPPAEAAVPISKAKAFLRIGHDSEDNLIADLVSRATARVEQASGLALVLRTLRVEWSCWPPDLGGRGVRLPVWPVSALQAVNLVEIGENEEKVVSDETARFRLELGKLALRPWSMVPGVPPGGSIEVEFDAGFGMSGDVPADLVEAVLRTAAAAYAARSPGSFDFAADQGALPPDVVAILDRRQGVRL